jgi:hypothetical protein
MTKTDTLPQHGKLFDFAEGDEPTVPRAPFELEDTDPADILTALSDPYAAQKEWGLESQTKAEAPQSLKRSPADGQQE